MCFTSDFMEHTIRMHLILLACDFRHLPLFVALRVCFSLIVGQCAFLMVLSNIVEKSYQPWRVSYKISIFVKTLLAFSLAKQLYHLSSWCFKLYWLWPVWPEIKFYVKRGPQNKFRKTLKWYVEKSKLLFFEGRNKICHRNALWGVMTQAVLEIKHIAPTMSIK